MVPPTSSHLHQQQQPGQMDWSSSGGYPPPPLDWRSQDPQSVGRGGTLGRHHPRGYPVEHGGNGQVPGQNGHGQYPLYHTCERQKKKVTIVEDNNTESSVWKMGGVPFQILILRYCKIVNSVVEKKKKKQAKKVRTILCCTKPFEKQKQWLWKLILRPPRKRKKIFGKKTSQVCFASYISSLRIITILLTNTFYIPHLRAI